LSVIPVVENPLPKFTLGLLLVIVYAPVAIALLLYPLAMAMALIVWLVLTEIGEV
jgi:hypothetical protein